MSRFQIDSERSSVLIAARSSMGPVIFEAREIAGYIEADVVDGVVAAESGPDAELQIALSSLRSGNDLYDAELRRRIDARRYPQCVLRLTEASGLTATRFTVSGEIEFHGSSRSTAGMVDVELASTDRIAITGTKELDIRDFGIPAPGILMVKIYPEVEVQIFLDARS